MPRIKFPVEPVHETQTFFLPEKFFPTFFTAKKSVPAREIRHFLKKIAIRSKVNDGKKIRCQLYIRCADNYPWRGR